MLHTTTNFINEQPGRDWRHAMTQCVRDHDMTRSVHTGLYRLHCRWRTNT